ncbi:TonB family protein [Ponticoccus alexandrii]|uniref:TonB family protein n=1 Tax=Ponticoccus alexandrii TaxID=1943633 RepID=A0ABX7FCK9_9RHOB|nr:TonB family protein [Ponticoccus alexandrii]ETA50256.1 hypothetical protein P279_20330 [Rhodobacteraceae bacterium PD-2]QRF67107.1 TonB family protein [Ponticoccus alexandrii]
MKLSSRTAKVAALATALAAHGALAVATNTPEETLMEGAAGAGAVRLGNAFADMAAGTLSPDATKAEVTPAEAAEPIDEADPDTAEQSRPEATEQAPPEVTDRAEAERPEQPRPRPAEPAPRPQQIPAETAEPEAAQPAPALAPAEVAVATPTEPVEAERSPEALSAQPAPTETPQALTAEPVQPLQATRPVETAAPPEPQTEALSGAAPDSATVTRSLRPIRRSAEFEAKHQPPPAPKKPLRQAAPAKKPAGNGNQNARAGAATGSETATARRSGSGGNNRDAGNAAASNYPGQVMAKLSRAGRPRVNARGTAVVSFTISSGGSIARVGLARSSGSSALDRAAVQIVRQAAPFPRPPAGAQRSFSINIQGR